MEELDDVSLLYAHISKAKKFKKLIKKVNDKCYKEYGEELHADNRCRTELV